MPTFTIPDTGYAGCRLASSTSPLMRMRKGLVDTFCTYSGTLRIVGTCTILQLCKLTFPMVSSALRRHATTARQTTPLALSVTEITQLAILFTPGSKRRLKKSSYSAKFKNQLLLNNFSSAHPIVLSIEDRADFHCWLKPPNKCTQTTLIC